MKWSGLLTQGEETHVFRVRIDPPLVVPSPSASRVSPDVADSALASYARETGRSEVAICLYVDPSTGLDAGAARASLQSSVDTLVRQGYTVLGARPVALCPQAPVFIRTSTVHPKNSGSGLPVGTTARVTTPSPILLFVAVTTPSRINFIFGGLTTRRGAEEATCAGDNCREVTGSIYSDPSDREDRGHATGVERDSAGLHDMTPFGARVVHRPRAGSSIWSRSRTSISLNPLSRSRMLDSLAQAHQRLRHAHDPAAHAERLRYWCESHRRLANGHDHGGSTERKTGQLPAVGTQRKMRARSGGLDLRPAA